MLCVKSQFRSVLLLLGLVMLFSSACSSADRTTHDKFDMSARDYFEDCGVIRLCHAIERDDLEEIKRLVKEDQVDVNTQGKDNVTPLLWSFFDNKVERFKLLLELGADPNVALTDDVGKGQVFQKGMSITHIAAKTKFPDHFKLVMLHGGDPNLLNYWEDAPIITVIRGRGTNKRERLRLLIDAGADLNYMSLLTHRTPLSVSVVSSGRFGLALMLLENGADARICYSSSGQRFVNTFEFISDKNSEIMDAASRANYEKIVKWLEDHGEDLEQARERRRLLAGGIYFEERSEDHLKYLELKKEIEKTGKECFEKTKKIMRDKLKKWERERRVPLSK